MPCTVLIKNRWLGHSFPRIRLRLYEVCAPKRIREWSDEDGSAASSNTTGSIGDGSHRPFGSPVNQMQGLKDETRGYPDTLFVRILYFPDLNGLDQHDDR